MIGFSVLLHIKKITAVVCLFAFLLTIYNLITIEQKSKSLLPVRSSQRSIHKTKYISVITNQTLPTEVNLLRMIETKTNQILNEDFHLTLDIWLNSGKINYNDSLLVEYVKQIYLIPPNKLFPYSLSSNISTLPSKEIHSLVKFPKNITDGFFIDCGARDGEFLSNTLWLEKEKGWDGILIEADPKHFSILRTKNRRAWLANLCLSPVKIPKMASFYRRPLYKGGLNGLKMTLSLKNKIQVQCIPLYTILLALKRNVIDFFSLNIQGMELEVLKTIPFDKILIKTLVVEHKNIQKRASGLYKFMTTKGYLLYKQLRYDSLFVHTSLLPGKSLK